LLFIAAPSEAAVPDASAASLVALVGQVAGVVEMLAG
jgi:hypothetical protein